MPCNAFTKILMNEWMNKWKQGLRGEMTHRWKQMISVSCLTKHIRGVWQLFSRGFGKRTSDGCCLHTWLAGRLSRNQGHRLVMWHHIVFRVKPTVLNVIFFVCTIVIMFQMFHIPYLGWVFFIHQTHINLRENDNRFITRLFQSVSFSFQTIGKTTCGEKVCRCRENIIFSPVFSSFCWNVGFYLPAENFFSLFLCRVAADAWKEKQNQGVFKREDPTPGRGCGQYTVCFGAIRKRTQRWNRVQGYPKKTLFEKKKGTFK